MPNLNISIPKVNIVDMDHKKYIEYLRDRGYSREQICIDETYTDIVTMRSLAKGSTGTVIDIRCPSRYKMIVVGSLRLSDECDIETASSLMVRFADSENIEIDPDIRIRIVKEKVSQAITLVDTMFYKDISAKEYTKTFIKSENKTKSFDKRYIFNKGIDINGDEHMQINVVQPNIGIDSKNTKLSLDLDLWEQD